MPGQPVDRAAPDRPSAATGVDLKRLLEEERAQVAALQSRLKEATSRLEQANRELESLSYSVSHDLRAPLRAIDGFSRILEEDYTDRLDSEGLRVLSVIRDSTARIGRLI
jgi:two-component system sensor kinase